MLNYILGKCSTGKTKYLRNIVSSSTNVVTNLSGVQQKLKVDARVVELIKEELIFDSLEFDYETGKIIKATFDNGDKIQSISFSFLELLNILCADAEVICIDDPEVVVSMSMSSAFIQVLAVVSKYRDVWVTTHLSEYLAISSDPNYYSVSDNRLELIKEFGIEQIT